MTRTTISFAREDMQLRRRGAKRQGSSVSQIVREAALMHARMASDKTRTQCATSPRNCGAIGDQGYALAEEALRVAEDEARRNR
jgi:hypothetical protein